MVDITLPRDSSLSLSTGTQLMNVEANTALAISKEFVGLSPDELEGGPIGV